MPEVRRGTLLGFDFGLARIGVAVGEWETLSASALETIAEASADRRFARIAALLAQWQPVAIVVGVPCAPDGSEHAMTQRCRRFANQLRGRYALPVFETDERYSSQGADSALREAGLTRWQARKGRLDAHAAQFILQQFLDRSLNATA